MRKRTSILKHKITAILAHDNGDQKPPTIQKLLRAFFYRTFNGRAAMTFNDSDATVPQKNTCSTAGLKI